MKALGQTPPGVDETAPIRMGSAPAGAVVVHRHMVYDSGLVHPLDHVVLLHLLFVVAEGKSVNVQRLWRELQAQGVRSAKNANELVGRTAVYESFNRLIEARFVRRVQAGAAAGRFEKVAYELYPQPAWNPDANPSAEPWDPRDHPDFPVESPQVRPLTGTPEAVGADSGGKDVFAGQTAYRNAGSGNAASGVPVSGRGVIPAGRTAYRVPVSGTAAPPHPPEEVTTSSLCLLTKASGARPPSPAEHEVRNPTKDEVASAARFLQLLPQPWSLGRPKAKRLAVLLVEAMADQEWPALPDLTDTARSLLVAQLTKNPQKVNNYASVLEKDRIANLPLYEVVIASRTWQTGHRQPEAENAGRADGHCGDLRCDPVTRTRESRDADGLLTLRPCPACRPSTHG